MINAKNPSVILMNDPKGIDFSIAQVQDKLGNLAWLEKVYGRAFIQSEKDQKKKETLYPELIGEKQEPFNGMPNDNLQAYSFFIVHDPGEFPDGSSFMVNEQRISHRVSIVFWFNAKKLRPLEQYPQRINEELKVQVLAQLRSTPRISTIFRTYEGYTEVFKEFTITDTYRQYLKFPYNGFRIDCTMWYDAIEC